jgi:hypothetical protein
VAAGEGESGGVGLHEGAEWETGRLAVDANGDEAIAFLLAVAGVEWGLEQSRLVLRSSPLSPPPSVSFFAAAEREALLWLSLSGTHHPPPGGP